MSEDYVHSVTIGGVECIQYLMEYEVDDSTEEVVDSARLVALPNILTDSTVNLTPGSDVVIRRGNSSGTIIIFRGYVTIHTPQTSQVSIECRNKLWLLQQRQVTKSYDINIDTQAGKISEIVKSLVTTYGGLNADSSSIQDSGTTLTLTKYICRNDVVFERIMKLVDILNWQFYYNPVDDKVYFEPLGKKIYSETVTFNLTNPTVSPYDDSGPVIERDYKTLYNKITINGAKQLDTRVANFTGNGVQTAFTLPFTPDQTQVTVAGVLKVRGAVGQSGTSFDYTVDSTLNQITFVTAPAGAAAIVVTYSAMVPTPVVVDDPTSIEAYCPTNSTTGLKQPFEKTFTFNDIIDIPDAISRARKLLTYYSTPIITYRAHILQTVPLVYPGYSVTVQDDVNLYSGTLICRQITRRYPEPHDEIVLCDKRVFREADHVDVVTRLNLLEKESFSNIGILTHMKQTTRDLKVERRHLLFKKKLVSGSQMIWDHVTQGKWDTYKWADSLLSGTEVLTQVIPGNGIFKEFFYDSVYVDTLNTTATIDTTNLQVYN